MKEYQKEIKLDDAVIRNIIIIFRTAKTKRHED